MTFQPLSGILQQTKYLPLRYAPLEIELELADATDPVISVFAAEEAALPRGLGGALGACLPLLTLPGKVPGKDYLCAAAPGTASAYTFNVDSFAMFKLKDAGAQKAQGDLAAAIMGTDFQEVFNLNKGSIPVRLNMKMDKFDDCAKLSSKDFVDTAKSGGLVPSVAHGMAIAPAAEGAIKDAVSQFWNDDKISVADGVKNIAKAATTK